MLKQWTASDGVYKRYLVITFSYADIASKTAPHSSPACKRWQQRDDLLANKFGTAVMFHFIIL